MMTVNGPFIFALIIIVFIVVIKWIEWYLFRNGTIRIEKKSKEIESEQKESSARNFLLKVKETLFFDKGDLKRPWYVGFPLVLFLLAQNFITYFYEPELMEFMCFFMLGFLLTSGCDLLLMLNVNKNQFLDKNLKKRFVKTQLAQIGLFFVLVGVFLGGLCFHDSKIQMDPPSLKESVEWVIEPIYDGAWPRFTEGLAPVKKDNAFGFIDQQGNVAVPFQYDAADNYYEGLAAVEKNGKWGYIDSKGKEMIPFQYSAAVGFGDGLAPVEMNDQWMVIDQKGNIIFKTNYDTISQYHEGAANVEMNGKEYKANMIDKEGNILFKGDYSFEGYFSEGCLLVCNDETGMCYFIDKSEKKVISLNFVNAGSFAEGYAPVWLENQGYALIDHKGNIVKCLSEDEYYNYQVHSEGLSIFLEGEWNNSLFKKNTLRYGLVDLYGNVIVPASFREATDSSDGLIGLKVNGLWGFVKNPLPEAARGVDTELWKEDRTQIAIVEGLPLYAGELEEAAYSISESNPGLFGIPSYQNAFEQLKKEKAFEKNGVEIPPEKIQYQIGSSYYKKILLENQ